MDFRETWPHARPSMNAVIECGDDSLFERLLEENCPVDVADNRGWRPLHVAAAKGRLSIVQRLLQHEDIAIDWRSFEGETALWVATMKGHLQICKCLLENGAKPNICNNENESPLHIAVRKGLLDCARLLLQFGANVNAVDYVGDTPVIDAAKLGFADVVTLLIESSADVYVADDHGISPLFAAAMSGNLPCVRLIHEIRRCRNGDSNVDVEAWDGSTPMMIAAQCGHLDCVRFLLDEGADANRAANDGVLALHLATQKDHLGCVKLLLPRTSRYALLKACYGSQVIEDPDWLPAFLDRVTGNGALELPKYGVSLLHLAVEWERLEILQHFLESGMHPDHFISIPLDLNLRWRDHYLAVTPLGLACCKGSVESVTLLLDHGARFSLGNDLICHPLRCALTGNCPSDFIRFLVKRGADVNGHEKDDNAVPLAISIALKHPDLLHELLVLGCPLKNWNPEVPRGVGHTLVVMARLPSNGDLLLKLLSALVHFAPRHQFRPLCSTLKSICEADPTVSLDGWRDLDQVLASPQSLLQLCRLKTRDVIMMRRGFRLEPDVSTLRLPQSLREYLMFH